MNARGISNLYANFYSPLLMGLHFFSKAIVRYYLLLFAPAGLRLFQGCKKLRTAVWVYFKVAKDSARQFGLISILFWTQHHSLGLLHFCHGAAPIDLYLLPVCNALRQAAGTPFSS